jgi:type VI secretion system secreted protein VgrG
MQVSLNGQDVTQATHHVSIRLTMGTHSHFEVRQNLDDSSAKFVDTLKKKTGELLGKDAVLSFGTTFNGVITSVSLGRSASGGSVLVVKGQSPTIKMDNGAHTKSFYDKPLKAIVSDVSGKFGSVTVDNKIEKPTDKLRFTVQYKESAFAFLSRLSARYGQWLFYDGEKMYIGKKPEGGSVELKFGEDVKSIDLSVRAVPVNFEISAYDYKKHEPATEKPDYSGFSELSQMAYDKGKSDIYDATPKNFYSQYTSEKDLKQFVETHQQAQVSEMVFLNAYSTNDKLKLGGTISLKDDRKYLEGGTDNYGEYIITSLSHSFSLSGVGQKSDYSNSFEAIPVESKVPPVSAPMHPPAAEMQLAKVVKVDDKDALGRVKVKFMWQQDKHETPWMRVASPYSGKDKGFYILPEVGDQVLVAFENNNPERPYVLTSMYNNEDKPEHHHMENHKKAIKTKGGHEVMMHDEKGKEKFAIFSPKDASIRANTGTISFSAAGDITISSDKKNITISCPETITLKAKNIIIDASDKLTMKSNEIDSNATIDYKVESGKFSVNAKGTGKVSATTTLDVEATGITSVKGSIVKLN